MASEYNSRPLVPEVLVHGDHYAVVRARPSFDEMLERDTIPDWLDCERLTEVRWRDRESGADEGGAARPAAAATPCDAGRSAPQPRRAWRSNPSPAPSGRSARRSPCSGRRWPSGSPRSLTRAQLIAVLALGGARARLAARRSGCAASAGRAPTTRGRGSTRPCRAGRSRRCATRRRSGRDDPGARAVWAAHLARMRRLAGQRAGRCRPTCGWRRATPGRCGWWRWCCSSRRWSSRATAAVRVGAGGAAGPIRRRRSRPGPSYEGWAEPPAYTGRPTLYLPEVPAARRSPVPQGTVVTLRVYGDAGALRARRDRVGRRRRRWPRRRRASPTRGLPGRGRRDGDARARAAHTLGRWTFAMEPDAAPTIAMTGGLERAASGETRLAYTAQRRSWHHRRRGRRSRSTSGAVDRRYGLAAEPEARPALVADLPMPMSGGSADDRGDAGRGFLQASAGRPAGDGAALGRGRDRARPAKARRSRRCCRCGRSTTRWRWRWSSSGATCCGRRRTPGG